VVLGIGFVPVEKFMGFVIPLMNMTLMYLGAVCNCFV